MALAQALIDAHDDNEDGSLQVSVRHHCCRLLEHRLTLLTLLYTVNTDVVVLFFTCQWVEFTHWVETCLTMTPQEQLDYAHRGSICTQSMDLLLALTSPVWWAYTAMFRLTHTEVEHALGRDSVLQAEVTRLEAHLLFYAEQLVYLGCGTEVVGSRWSWSEVLPAPAAVTEQAAASEQTLLHEPVIETVLVALVEAVGTTYDYYSEEPGRELRKGQGSISSNSGDGKHHHHHHHDRDAEGHRIHKHHHSLKKLTQEQNRDSDEEGSQSSASSSASSEEGEGKKMINTT
jgi:hypothetical protein